MKRWILAGALASVAFGGLAYAGQTGSSPLAQNETDQNPIYQPPPANPEAPPTLAPQHYGVEKRNPWSVTAGAGVDGYMGVTNSLVAPGFGWGARLLGQPTRALGLELNYSGSTHEVRGPVNIVGGADIVRNGVSAAISLGPPWRVQPYLMTGYGLNFYTARQDTQAFGFRNDTAGDFPFGAGLRAKAGHFTMDARFDYNLGVGEQFAPTGPANADRYSAQLQLGGSF